MDIENETLVNYYKHMSDFTNADFTGAKGIDKETAIQLQKNGAIINVADYE